MLPRIVGFRQALRGFSTAQKDGSDRRDVGVMADGTVSPLIERYAAALREMTGRRLVRDDPSGYEAIAVAIVENDGPQVGMVLEGFPAPDADLDPKRFFRTLYRVYDSRFPFRGEGVAEAPCRYWSPDSPLFRELEKAFGSTRQTEMGIEARLSP